MDGMAMYLNRIIKQRNFTNEDFIRLVKYLA